MDRDDASPADGYGGLGAARARWQGLLDSFCTRLIMATLRRMKVGRLSITLPDGRIERCGGDEASGPHAAIRIVRPAGLARMLMGGSTGLAEAYMNGDWETNDLLAVIELGLANEKALGAAADGTPLIRWVDRLVHRARPNSRRGSRRNIAYHYDLGNAFYRQWLDRSMTYSSAIFTQPGQSLEDAQAVKYRRLADSLNLTAAHHVLEIGCGWGGFAVTAAGEYGCRVTAITLSEEQYRYARARVAEAGLAERVDIRLQDYRDVGGHYDRVASIEMFEAVGENNWSTFFDTLCQRLKPGGVAAMQVISIADERFEQYRTTADFIQRYIFPGGMLPCPSVFETLIRNAGLQLTDRFHFGSDYGETLRVWRKRFGEAWPNLRRLGFDERFRRMWDFYLVYCEAGFNAGAIDVGQYKIQRA